jgi:3-oxoacyl-[acyl-carrier-protein] synthase-1
MVYKVADNILSPLGATTAENYRAVKAGRSALARNDRRWLLPDEQLTASLFSKEQESQFLVDGLSRFESMAVTSVRQALSQTTLDVSQPDVVFILSTTKADVELLTSGTTHQTVAVEESVQSPADSAVHIAKALGFTTEPIVVCNACTSGLSALILASRLLTIGAYEYAVVCGADSQSRFIVSGFQSLKALSPEMCRPFDMERMGLNLGEAAATMILGKGGGAWTIGRGAVRNDASHISNPIKTGEGSYRALSAVVGDDRLSSYAFVNAHGTATIFNDQMESVAIQRAGLSTVPVNAYKGYYGHTMGAAGVLETILSMAALDDHTILGTRGFEELGVSGNVSLSAAHQSTDKRSFVKMLSGFGGCNAVQIFSRGEEEGVWSENTSLLELFATGHTVLILPDSVLVDGKEIDVEGKGKDLLTALYRQYVGDYPKFYKMDGLSRLGFMASELLLQAEGNDVAAEGDNRAVVLFNHSSSVSADRAYLDTIADPNNCFPSPSVFVYTLPNIVTGEIAIRHHYHGETSFYILPRRDEALMVSILRATFVDTATRSAVCGWLDYVDDQHFMADLQIVTTKSM